MNERNWRSLSIPLLKLRYHSLPHTEDKEETGAKMVGQSTTVNWIYGWFSVLHVVWDWMIVLSALTVQNFIAFYRMASLVIFWKSAWQVSKKSLFNLQHILIDCISLNIHSQSIMILVISLPIQKSYNN